MIQDKELIFSAAQALTSASAISTNVVDQGAAGDADEALWLVIRIDTTFDSSGDASTVTCDLRTSAAENMSSETVLASFPAFTAGSGTGDTAGDIVAKIRVPKGTKRYLACYYTLSAACTAGKIDAFLVKDVDALS